MTLLTLLFAATALGEEVSPPFEGSVEPYGFGNGEMLSGDMFARPLWHEGELLDGHWVSAGDLHHADAHHAHAAEGHEHHAHAHHETCHECLHEEPGRLVLLGTVTGFHSKLWRDAFHPVYGFNAGTVFWHHEPHCCNGRPVHFGLLAEFRFGSTQGRSHVNLRNLNPLGPPNTKMKRAELYEGNLGLAFASRREAAGGTIETGVAPFLSVGSMNADLGPNDFDPTDKQLVVLSPPSKNGTIVGGHLRLWTAYESAGGTKVGGFVQAGISETDAIFSNSERMNTYGGGLYLDMPTDCIPAELPHPMGALQWIEWLFHLE
ncbi:MAG: hypothetical protein KY476_01750 [Planctomycetes bacterium]|nr:hypothetical protein [Planctomycetota bacterium]